MGKVGLFLGCAGLAVLVAAVGVQDLLFDGDFLYIPYLVVPGLALLVVGFLFSASPSRGPVCCLPGMQSFWWSLPWQWLVLTSRP